MHFTTIQKYLSHFTEWQNLINSNSFLFCSFQNLKSDLTDLAFNFAIIIDILLKDRM